MALYMLCSCKTFFFVLVNYGMHLNWRRLPPWGNKNIIYEKKITINELGDHEDAVDGGNRQESLSKRERIKIYRNY